VVRCALLLLVVPALSALPLPLRAGIAGDACAHLTQVMSALPGTALFLPSYPGAPDGPLHQVAFLYDNAVTASALIACGQVPQAQRIGEAMLLALDHDRYWHDGRLRNGYAAGAVAPGTMRMPGWWDAQSQRWLEDGYQAGSDSGNLAWAALALLNLHDAVPGEFRYLRSAERLAGWLETQRDERGEGGFDGGSFGSEAAPRALRWKSTEHNADLAAAFARLARTTGDRRWQSQAQAAAHFVERMWDHERSAFAAGTAEDGVSRNLLLALDAQVLPLLALPPGSGPSVEALRATLQRLHSGDGYAYSEAGGGAWTEGSAQVMLLRSLTRAVAWLPPADAALQAALAPDGGYFATASGDVPTGFMLDTVPAEGRVYRHVPHLGAAAWVALAQQGFNPFSGARSLPR